MLIKPSGCDGPPHFAWKPRPKFSIMADASRVFGHVNDQNASPILNMNANYVTTSGCLNVAKVRPCQWKHQPILSPPS